MYVHCVKRVYKTRCSLCLLFYTEKSAESCYYVLEYMHCLCLYMYNKNATGIIFQLRSHSVNPVRERVRERERASETNRMNSIQIQYSYYQAKKKWAPLNQIVRDFEDKNIC